MKRLLRFSLVVASIVALVTAQYFPADAMVDYYDGREYSIDVKISGGGGSAWSYPHVPGSYQGMETLSLKLESGMGSTKASGRLEWQETDISTLFGWHFVQGLKGVQFSKGDVVSSHIYRWPAPMSSYALHMTLDVETGHYFRQYQYQGVNHEERVDIEQIWIRLIFNGDRTIMAVNLRAYGYNDQGVWTRYCNTHTLPYLLKEIHVSIEPDPR